MPRITQLNQSIAESGESNAGVRSSNENVGSVGGSPKMASPEQLALALKASQEANLLKDAEIARLKAQQNPSDDGINKLANLLEKLVDTKQTPQGPMESDNLNRTADFQTKTTVDGRSLMEAQQVLQSFKNERKVPITIPKSYTSFFGPTLAITVNGARVGIPCDGKTYFINETHAEHAKERLAKVDNYTNDSRATSVEISEN